MPNSRIPVTIFTGFLGAGKTTILRHLLSQKSSGKLAVMINEFGNLGLDGDLIRSCGFCPENELDNRIVELNNGCLCCTVQEDFLPTLEQLISRSNQLDGIVIETSGLALPQPLIQALKWPSIRSKLYVNGLVTIVDGEALSMGSPVGDILALEKQRLSDKSLDHLTPIEELFSNQLECADLVLITRSDIISESQIDSIKKELIEQLNEGTPILPIANGAIDPNLLFSLNSNTICLPDLMINSDKKNDHTHHHHLKVESQVLRLNISLGKEEIEKILLESARDYKIIRLKGRCWIKNRALPLQLQMVGNRLNSWFEDVPESSWKPESTGLEIVVLSLDNNAAEKLTLRVKAGSDK
tara:strand:- start:2181 stop:3245 length:1065 start_codon:yes stop_codon:yes gene_type:complete